MIDEPNSVNRAWVKKRSDIYLLVFLAVAIAISVLMLWNPLGIVAVVNIGQDRRVVVYTTGWWEVNRPLYYQVRQGLGMIDKGCLIYYDLPGDPHEYEVIFADNQSLVGVLDTWEDPTFLFIMHDFSSGQSYPCGRLTNQERDALFERLRRENPDLERPASWDLTFFED